MSIGVFNFILGMLLRSMLISDYCSYAVFIWRLDSNSVRCLLCWEQGR